MGSSICTEHIYTIKIHSHIWIVRMNGQAKNVPKRKGITPQKWKIIGNDLVWCGGEPLMRFFITLHSTFSSISHRTTAHKKSHLHSWHFVLDAKKFFPHVIICFVSQLFLAFFCWFFHFSFLKECEMARWTVGQWNISLLCRSQKSNIHATILFEYNIKIQNRRHVFIHWRVRERDHHDAVLTTQMRER